MEARVENRRHRGRDEMQGQGSTGGSTVCFVTRYFPPMMGSGSPRVEDFSRRLTALGHRVHVVTLKPPRGFPYTPTHGEDVSAAVHRAPNIDSANTLLYALISTLTLFIQTVAVTLREDADVIVATVPNEDAGVAGWLASKVTCRPFIIDVRDDWELILIEEGKGVTKALSKLIHYVFNRIYASSERVVCTSETLRIRLNERGIPLDKSSMIPNGTDTTLFKPLTEKDRLNVRRRLGVGGSPVAVFTGTLSSHQAPETLIRATEKLMRRQPSTRLFIAGGGPLQKGLERLVQDMKLSDHVRFLGVLPRSMVAELIGASDVAVITLRGSKPCRSMLPIKFYEYLACGVPIVASVPTDSEIAELIREHRAGLVAPAESPEELAERMSHALSEKDAAAEWGMNGRKLAVEEYAQDKLALKLSTLIENTAK